MRAIIGAFLRFKELPQWRQRIWDCLYFWLQVFLEWYFEKACLNADYCFAAVCYENITYINSNHQKRRNFRQLVPQGIIFALFEPIGKRKLARGRTTFPWLFPPSVDRLPLPIIEPVLQKNLTIFHGFHVRLCLTHTDSSVESAV